MKQQMDSVTKKVLERLAEKPVVDEAVYGEEIRYCWVDDDHQRVSPVHKNFGNALSWISNWPEALRRRERWNAELVEYIQEHPHRHDHDDRHIKREEERLAKLEDSISLTGKPPVQLKRVVIRTIGEPIADYEQPPVEAAMRSAGLS